MKRIQTIIFGLFITTIGFSQNSIRVQILPSKLASRTLMIIPFRDKYIYEDYSYFKSVYWLNSTDTLEIINDSILAGESVRIDLNRYSIKYDFCDSKINKIRNSSLSHRIFSMVKDTCMKYIGWDNNEFENYQRDFAFENSIEEKICSDTFPLIAYKRFYSLNAKVQEIYNRKKQRTVWIKENHSDIDNEFINEFLMDFNYNENDYESFIQLIIANPILVIEGINNLKEPYMILWRVREIKRMDGISEAIKALEQARIKGKTKRSILHTLKKNEG